MRASNKSRSRNKNNNRRNNNMGNVVNRVFDSAGPEGRVRGTPQQIIEKYRGLARDAQLADDRVGAENFQQHAEHYSRLLLTAQKQIAERQAEQQAQQKQRQKNAAEQNDDSTESINELDAIDVEDNVSEENLVATPEDKGRPKQRGRNGRSNKPKPVEAELDLEGAKQPEITPETETSAEA